MRNAAASYDDDYALDEPAPRSKPTRKARGSGPKKKSGTRGRKGPTPYLHYAAIGLSASLAVGIMVNALILQHSRHPAPLFGKAIALGDAPAPAPTVTPPAASAIAAALAPAPATPASAIPATAPPVPHPHRAAVDAPTAAPRAKGDDPIARLLKASTGGEKTPDKVAGKENAKTVLATQHALLKLGFVVKPSGAFGPTTKSALEAFERDQHLPVKGEMSRKLLKQLSAESGVAID